MTVPPALLDLAALVLPSADLSRATLARGEFHDVVLVAGVAAIRVARSAEAAELLPRRVELLRRLSHLELPFAVPRPLSEVIDVDCRRAVAVTWIPGKPARTASPASLSRLLATLAEVPLAALVAYLDAPHAYAGRADWEHLMIDQALPLLPDRQRQRAEAYVRRASALPPVRPSLVHGDLAGANVHWDGQGHLVGVLDWDLAQAFDPAVDAACLGSFGWENLRAAVNAVTYERAHVWAGTFPLEGIVSALLTPGADVEARARQASRWFDAWRDL